MGFLERFRGKSTQSVGVVPSNQPVGLNVELIRPALGFSPRYVISNDDCARREGLTRAGPGIEVVREENSIFNVGQYASVGLMVPVEKRAAYRTPIATHDAMVSSRGGYPVIRTLGKEFAHPKPGSPVLAVYGTTERRLRDFAKP